jgi:type II restriction/modification system DNA methylase subunit YeeA
LYESSKLDWSTVEPATFGTLFERSLDPSKRQQLGAHYTSPDNIKAILDPVVFAPLRAEWALARSELDKFVQISNRARTSRESKRAMKSAEAAVAAFLDRLLNIKILDPACGSGNFLYLALRGLKDLEGEVIAYGAERNLARQIPFVSPRQLFGIEINHYAHELAQVVVWIGHIQWGYQNSFRPKEEPILRSFDNIKCADALLCGDQESAWPEVDFIVGNPPFLGGKLLRSVLGDGYVNNLFETFNDRVPRESDLVCYWFEKARAQIQAGKAERGGLVATNSIRGGSNRKVVEKISQDVGLFMAWSDRAWVLEGAAVRVSMLGFGKNDLPKTLDGQVVS